MSKKKALPSGQPTAITFRKDLLVPPATQLQQYEDAVSARVRELDSTASRFAQGFGIGYTPGILLDESLDEETHELLVVFARGLVAKQRVSLEKINGNWGLVYSYEPPVIRTGNDRSFRGPLRDAPLDVREKFLHRSEEFFRRYLASCQGRLTGMKDAVSAGDRTLELLQSIQLT